MEWSENHTNISITWWHLIKPSFNCFQHVDNLLGVTAISKISENIALIFQNLRVYLALHEVVWQKKLIKFTKKENFCSVHQYAG